jgi:MoaA/NifB/PqqE/SkfB family radical SAM enzyme
VLAARETKAIEFAGGGEPLLWPQFSEGVLYAKNKGLKVSLITNGLALGDIPKGTLAELAWLRVSVQSIRHAEAVNFKHAQEATRVSASFIATGTKELKDLRDFARSVGIVTRVAIKQPCDNDMAYRMVKSVTEALGDPLFFADKPTGTPPGCYMAWIRAAIDWKGFFLPCPSVMVSDGSGKVKDEFRLCHVSKLDQWLDKNTPKDLGFRCGFCNCGKEHNDLIHGIMSGVDDADFV